MAQLFTSNSGYFHFNQNIWGRKVSIKIMTDNKETAQNNIPEITEKLSRIERNRRKIAELLYKDHNSVHSSYNTETLADFTEGLYISDIRAEIYRNNEVEMIFSVKSTHKYPLDFFYECELHSDNSIDI